MNEKQGRGGGGGGEEEFLTQIRQNTVGARAVAR